MTEGMIFDITHGSFVDGPGIRTTVFFKGCNLNCKWCHNPESQSFDVQMMRYKDKCKNCGLCREVCTSPDECSFCGKCGEVCPNKGIIISGKKTTAEDIFEIIYKDRAFYGKYGDINAGGVTFSGGECMLQIDFLSKLLKMCKKAEISTAVDTAGHVKWEYFERILDYTDLFLYDIKCMNTDVHKEMTGVHNELILENLTKLLKTDKRIWIRVPVIPGINDTEEEMVNLGKFLSIYGSVEKIELMPYHTLGIAKYEALGIETTPFEEHSKEKIKELEKILNVNIK